MLGSRFGVWGAFAVAFALVSVACGARDDGLSFEDLYGDADAGTGGTGGGTTAPAHANRVDVLLVVDNSGFMAPKQAVLAETIPYLIDGFLNPRCANGSVAYAPVDANGQCPSGTKRLFPPVTDLHIGVITSSLGGHGSDSCLANVQPAENDRGRLINRTPGGSIATYQNLGFLAWDPQGKKKPAGDSSQSKLTTTVANIVLGAADEGCGYEATQEAWYRFLVDPDPYQSIDVQLNNATPKGTDTVLLAQRAKFLRPDSLLLILVLSDENDCSIRDGSQYFFAAQRYIPGGGTAYHLPKPRMACALDPSSKCCRSCGQPPETVGCGEFMDNCDANKDGKPDPVANEDDSVALRCWDQKRRFGIDFLYPIERYSDGLSRAKVTDRHGNLLSNPIFSDLDSSDGFTPGRDPRLVRFGAIVGVPWQDIARRGKTGGPDLAAGADEQGRAAGGVMSGKQLIDNDVYALVLGDPAQYVPNPVARPKDPLMIESVSPRSGTHPLTGQPLAPPGSPPTANTINGHEYLVPTKDALQYACIFRLPKALPCPANDCPCSSPDVQNPLCEDDGAKYTGTQLRAHAYPGIRHLQLTQTLGERATVGSICPDTSGTPSTIGYQPFVKTLVQSVAPVLE